MTYRRAKQKVASDSETESQDFRKMTRGSRGHPPSLDDFKLEGGWQTKSTKRPLKGSPARSTGGRRKKLTKAVDMR